MHIIVGLLIIVIALMLPPNIRIGWLPAVALFFVFSAFHPIAALIYGVILGMIALIAFDREWALIAAFPIVMIVLALLGIGSSRPPTTTTPPASTTTTAPAEPPALELLLASWN